MQCSWCVSCIWCMDLCVVLNVNCSLIINVHGYTEGLYGEAVCCYVACVLSNAQDKFLTRLTIILSHLMIHWQCNLLILNKTR